MSSSSSLTGIPRLSTPNRLFIFAYFDDVYVDLVQGCLGNMPKCDAVQLLVDRFPFPVHFFSQKYNFLSNRKLLDDMLFLVLQLLVDFFACSIFCC